LSASAGAAMPNHPGISSDANNAQLR